MQCISATWTCAAANTNAINVPGILCCETSFENVAESLHSSSIYIDVWFSRLNKPCILFDVPRWIFLNTWLIEAASTAVESYNFIDQWVDLFSYDIRQLSKSHWHNSLAPRREGMLTINDQDTKRSQNISDSKNYYRRYWIYDLRPPLFYTDLL